MVGINQNESFFLVWNSTAKSIFHMYVVFPPAQTNRALIPGLVRASSGAGWVTRVLKVYWAVAEEKKKKVTPEIGPSCARHSLPQTEPPPHRKYISTLNK